MTRSHTHRRRNVSGSRRRSTSRSKPYLLIIDIGTFCDHRMMDVAVSRLRANHRLVYITDKSHKLQGKDDVHVTYSLPQEILANPGDITTHLTGKTISQLYYTLKHPSTISRMLYSLYNVVNILQQVVAQYAPVRIMAHYGNLQHILVSGVYEDIPTSILHFAPGGGLPNKQVPFVFHNRLNDSTYDVFNTDFCDFNVKSAMAFMKQLERLVRVKRISHKPTIKGMLTKLRHIMCFSRPLVPPIQYTIPDMDISQVGILPARLSNDPLDASLQKWLNRHPGKVIFVSFGSYTRKITTTFTQLLHLLDETCTALDVYVLFHDDITKCAFKGTFKSRRIRFQTSFVPYPTIVRYCELVCFTGSACLQNVCWQLGCKMLFIPELPEQYLWAKLYRKHTLVDFIQYQNPAEMYTFVNKVYYALHANMNIFKTVAASISPTVADQIARIVCR